MPRFLSACSCGMKPNAGVARLFGTLTDVRQDRLGNECSPFVDCRGYRAPSVAHRAGRFGCTRGGDLQANRAGGTRARERVRLEVSDHPRTAKASDGLRAVRAARDLALLRRHPELLVPTDLACRSLHLCRMLQHSRSAGAPRTPVRSDTAPFRWDLLRYFAAIGEC